MKKLCVLFGGTSCEHDISVITGMQLSKAIEEKYSIEKIYHSLDGKFYLATGIKELSFFSNKKNIKLKEVFFKNGALYKFGKIISKICDISCVVNCSHGGVGENGDLAGFFEVNQIKTTSANSLASHIAMDKSLAKKMVSHIIPTIKGEEITKQNINQLSDLIESFDEDVIVKPNSLGSSIGVKATKKEKAIEQINTIFEMNDTALVENRIKDLCEYNQACFADRDEIVLSEIEQPIAKSNFLTFEDKYQHNIKGKGADRVLPAKITKKLREQISAYTRAIYKELKMNGVVRIDYIFDKSTNNLYFNEINTNPGSMAYYLFEPVGIDYITLIEKIIDNASEVKKYTYFNSSVLSNKLL